MLATRQPVLPEIPAVCATPNTSKKAPISLVVLPSQPWPQATDRRRHQDKTKCVATPTKTATKSSTNIAGGGRTVAGHKEVGAVAQPELLHRADNPGDAVVDAVNTNDNLSVAGIRRNPPHFESKSSDLISARQRLRKTLSVSAACASVLRWASRVRSDTRLHASRVSSSTVQPVEHLRPTRKHSPSQDYL